MDAKRLGAVFWHGKEQGTGFNSTVIRIESSASRYIGAVFWHGKEQGTGFNSTVIRIESSGLKVHLRSSAMTHV